MAYDKAAIKLNRNTDLLNFPISNYASQLEHLARTSKEELIVELRRESAGFARGTSSYRGVSWRASTKRFEARFWVRSIHTLEPIQAARRQLVRTTGPRLCRGAVTL